MILIVALLIILFISYLISFLIKPFVAVFYGDKIKEKLKSLRKEDLYYKEQYKESRKYIDSLDKGFLKSVSDAFHGSDCTEEEYVVKKKEEEKKGIEQSYDSELSVYSFGLSFLCILGLVGFVFLKDDPAEPQKTKNPIAENKVYFKRQCGGLDLKTIEADFIKLSALQEEADMMKKRAKNLYKNGLILHSQYQQAKDNRSAIGIKWNKYAFCIQARADYKRSIATTITETSQEPKKNNVNQSKKNESIVNISAPIKQYTEEVKRTETAFKKAKAAVENAKIALKKAASKEYKFLKKAQLAYKEVSEALKQKSLSLVAFKSKLSVFLVKDKALKEAQAYEVSKSQSPLPGSEFKLAVLLLADGAVKEAEAALKKAAPKEFKVLDKTWIAFDNTISDCIDNVLPVITEALKQAAPKEFEAYEKAYKEWRKGQDYFDKKVTALKQAAPKEFEAYEKGCWSSVNFRGVYGHDKF